MKSETEADLFQSQDYRAYLRQEFSGFGPHRGRRLKLATALGCQTSFVSQVVTDRAHFSLEHAIKTSNFLNHSPMEKQYFMTLVQRDRAASSELVHHFNEELSRIRKKVDQIKERIGVKTQLSAEDQMMYYSAWYYSAIHILTVFPEFSSVEALAQKLKLEVQVVKRALQFLVERGFVTRGSQGYAIGKTRIHLPKGSAMLSKHHSNWRMRAMESAEHERPDELHYTAILGISKKDTQKFREKLLKLLEEFEPVVRDSKEEHVVAVTLDLFKV